MQDFVFLFIKILLFCLAEIVVGHILIHIEDKEDSKEDDSNASIAYDKENNKLAAFSRKMS